jgi:hypothetical protein
MTLLLIPLALHCLIVAIRLYGWLVMGIPPEPYVRRKRT